MLRLLFICSLDSNNRLLNDLTEINLILTIKYFGVQIRTEATFENVSSAKLSSPISRGDKRKRRRYIYLDPDFIQIKLPKTPRFKEIYLVTANRGTRSERFFYTS